MIYLDNASTTQVDVNADMHCPCEITHANAVRMQGIMYVPENI